MSDIYKDKYDSYKKILDELIKKIQENDIEIKKYDDYNDDQKQRNKYKMLIVKIKQKKLIDQCEYYLLITNMYYNIYIKSLNQ